MFEKGSGFKAKWKTSNNYYEFLLLFAFSPLPHLPLGYSIFNLYILSNTNYFLCSFFVYGFFHHVSIPLCFIFHLIWIDVQNVYY